MSEEQNFGGSIMSKLLEIEKELLLHQQMETLLLQNLDKHQEKQVEIMDELSKNMSVLILGVKNCTGDTDKNGKNFLIKFLTLAVVASAIGMKAIDVLAKMLGL